jgi:hypothetical protein
MQVANNNNFTKLAEQIAFQYFHNELQRINPIIDSNFKKMVANYLIELYESGLYRKSMANGKVTPELYNKVKEWIQKSKK